VQIPTRFVVQEHGYRKFVEFCRFDVNRIFLVSGSSAMHDAGVIADIEQLSRRAGATLEVWRGVSSNPTNQEIDEAVRAAYEFGADTVIGVGGGSSLDTAKITASAVGKSRPVWEYVNAPGQRARDLGTRSLRSISIPTTAGSGSEATPFAVMTNLQTRMKKGIQHYSLYPDVAIIDPTLSSSMPPHVTASSGFDAFGQALEAYTSVRATRRSDQLAQRALHRIIGSFEQSFRHPDDIRARTEMAWGATLAGMAIGLVDVNLAHAMSHPLSGHFGIAHGVAVAVCTPPAIWFNKESVGNKFIDVARMFGHDPADADCGALQTIGSIRKWADCFGLPLALSSLIAGPENLEQLSDDALEVGAIRTNSRSVSRSELAQLYRMAWSGEIG